LFLIPEQALKKKYTEINTIIFCLNIFDLLIVFEISNNEMIYHEKKPRNR